MTDETTPEEQPQSVEPATEEPQVNLAEEAAKGLRNEPAEKAKELNQQLTQELTPELIEKVNKLVESQTSSAIDGYRRKSEADFEKRLASQGYQTPEQVQAIVEEKLAFERQKAEAGRNLDRTLTSLGVKPESEAYKKVEKTFADGLESGLFTHRTLLSETGIKALAYAAGVLAVQPEKEEPKGYPGFGAHTKVTPVNKEGKTETLEQRVQQRMNQALYGS